MRGNNKCWAHADITLVRIVPVVAEDLVSQHTVVAPW